MTNPLPSPELLHKLLRYEPVTGKLFWRERPVDMFSDGVGRYTRSRNSKVWNSRYADSPAFTAKSHGYLIGRLFGKNHRSHRIIWAMVYGEWPKDEIDHINHDRLDNRISNLRDVTPQVNQRNQSLSKANTSGHVGVGWCKDKLKWYARFSHGGKNIHLGRFTTKSAALCIKRTNNIADFHSLVNP